ncbi:SufE family protein [Candidatus Shikimatogenerans bostrichidophilus]|uniref:SufE family protein n=1 Tax=Candidatus Shikimatogenerans bostrichidophilus TaxID=2943807 RepID=UPI0029665390
MFENYIINKIKTIKDKNKIYYFFIKIGKKLPYYPKKYKINKYLVKNCITNVWLYFKYKKNKLLFIGKSDSNIINGIIFLILKIFNNKSPLEIIKYKIKFIDKINLIELLSYTRYNGTLNIINEIKNIAYKCNN